MRITPRLFLVAATALTMAWAFAVPASAGTATYRPDARIELACEYVPDWQPCTPGWRGDDIYNRTAKKQKHVFTDYLTYSTEPDPRLIVFRISIQNGGNVADRFRIDADGETVGYVVKFLRKSTNITAAVEAGTYTTPVLAPGATFLIKAKVVMPCPSQDSCGRDRGFDVAERLVTIRSVGAPSVRDAVKFVREPWECTC